MAEVDLRSLDPRQLEGLRKQIDDELTLLQSNFTELKQAQQKFLNSAESVETLAKEGEHDVLVPMTSSLYVPGRLVGGSEVLVDIGAGFMVGKPPLEAKEILARKVAYLQNNTSTLAKVISQRQTNLQAVQQMMMERRNAIVAQQGTGGEVAAQ